VTDPLRFAFTRGDTIEDKFDKNRFWSVHLSQDGSTTDDYAIVTRLLNLKTGQILFTAAGIGQYGTQAASEFLSSPQRIKEFADRAPRDWNQKNVQIVLHIKVVDETPGTVDIVAVHYW
jgi:NAD dependent epimerase/dehydratase family enzyme